MLLIQQWGFEWQHILFDVRYTLYTYVHICVHNLIRPIAFDVYQYIKAQAQAKPMKLPLTLSILLQKLFPKIYRPHNTYAITGIRCL